MKLALHTVSYAGVWPGQVTLPLDRVIRKAAGLGYQGLEVMAKRPHASVLDMTTRRRRQLKRLLDAEGVEAACVAGYTDMLAGWDHTDNPYAEKEILYITALAELAAAWECDLIRIFTAYERPHLPYSQQLPRIIGMLQEASDKVASLGVTLAVQNHHCIGADYRTMADLLHQVNRPNCRAAFDAWSAAVQGADLAEAARHMAPWVAFTTVCDYQRRPRFHYDWHLTNYVRQEDHLQMVPMGEGFIDYRTFLGELRRAGCDGWIAFEMCAPFVEGGSEETLDKVAADAAGYVRELWGAL
ncbi:MAG: sugar phosphate isomerase/epimerase [Armatimonadota bacterium]|nr:MAG: sugar phosphate isomerase/epimerase [Armatimonadota bacterium]